MENFCHTYHANNSERTCLEFINSFTVMLILKEPPKKGKKDEEEGENDYEQEEEEEEEPPSHINLIWDETEVDNGDDDVLEEACVGNYYNLWSKGAPKYNDSPSSSKMVAKKMSSVATYTKISLEKAKDNEKDPTTITSTTSIDLTQKIIGDLKLDHDVVEYLKNMKANITVFELCEIKQLKEQLCEALQHIQVPQDVMVGNTKVTLKGKNVKVNKSTNSSSVNNKSKTMVDQKKGDPRADGTLIGKKSRSQTPPFLLTFEIFNRNLHNCLVDSRDSSNVMPY